LFFLLLIYIIELNFNKIDFTILILNMFKDQAKIDSLIEIGIIFNKYFKNFQNKNSTSMLKADALDYLIRNNHSSLSELSNYLNSSRPAVTILARKMILKGLINIDTDIKDKRKSRLTVTLKGANELERIKDLMSKELKKIFEVLTDDERSTYIRVQMKLISKMKELMKLEKN